MKTIAIGNQKGGVGKSTTVRNLAYHLTQNGHSVIMIDADPQASLTEMCGIEDTTKDGMVQMMSGHPYEDAITKVSDDLYLISSDIELSRVELQMQQRMFGRERIMGDLIDQLTLIGLYDYCLIDCPPSLNMLTINALVCADYVIIPTLPHVASARGVMLFLDTIEQVKAEMNPSLQLIGVLFNKWKGYKHHDQVSVAIDGETGVMRSRIGESVRIAEAAENGMALAELDKHNKQVENYVGLAQEVIYATA